MARKFNVGDVVINFEYIEFWDNAYHFEKTLQNFKKEVVVDADDYAFTTTPGIDVKKRVSFDWDKKRKIYDQRSGRQWGDLGATTSFYGNLTTNEAGIRAYLQKRFDAALKKCDDADAAEIASLEATIRAAQAKIEAIKAGKRQVSYKPELFERHFINERIEALNAVLAG